MLILEHHSPEQYEIYLKNTKVDLCEDLIQAQKDVLFQRFHKAFSDSVMQACVDVARTLNFTELAEEMERDMRHEKLMNFLND